MKSITEIVTGQSRLATVNVIEQVEGHIDSLTAYPDTEAGNKLAENHFKTIILENGAKEENLNTYIEEGYYENYSYTALLVHSLT